METPIGKVVKSPLYDFKRNIRLKKSGLIQFTKVVLFEESCETDCPQNKR